MVAMRYDMFSKGAGVEVNPLWLDPSQILHGVCPKLGELYELPGDEFQLHLLSIFRFRLYPDIVQPWPPSRVLRTSINL